MKRLLVAVCLLLCLFSAALAAEDPVKYTSGDYDDILLDDGTAQITRYFGTAAVVHLPDTIDGFTVTSLGDDISTMSSSAIVQRIFIPDTHTHMTGNPFTGCKYITDISVVPGHPVFKAIDRVLYDTTRKSVIAAPHSSIIDALRTYAVPAGTETIAPGAFYGSSRLESITIPDSVTFIDECAFNRCSGLRGITLSSGLTAIPDGFLTNSWLLGSLTIPEGVTSIGDSVLAYCASLGDVVIPASVTSIAPDAFDKSPNVTLIVPRDSYARQFAIEHGIAYTYEDADSWLK